jgi:hypothetical protein
VTADTEVLKGPPFVAAFLFVYDSVLGPRLAITEDSKTPLRTTNWSGFWYGWGAEVTTSWPIWVCRLSGASAMRPVPDGRVSTFATAEANSFISGCVYCRVKLILECWSCRHNLPGEESFMIHSRSGNCSRGSSTRIERAAPGVRPMPPAAALPTHSLPPAASPSFLPRKRATLCHATPQCRTISRLYFLHCLAPYSTRPLHPDFIGLPQNLASGTNIAPLLNIAKEPTMSVVMSASTVALNRLNPRRGHTPPRHRPPPSHCCVRANLPHPPATIHTPNIPLLYTRVLSDRVLDIVADRILDELNKSL